MGWKTAAALVALSFFGVGSLVYLMLQKDEENENYMLYKASKNSVLEVRVPTESVGIVIGRGGNTLNEIETKSHTSISVIDDSNSEDFKIFVISGLPECIQYAECLIHEIIVDQPFIETYVMRIPITSCGRVIGKGGDSIRMICRNSNAKLTLENWPVSSSKLEKKLFIKGTPEQIALAKTLVEQKLEEEIEFRHKLEAQVSNRSPRKPKYLLPLKGEQEETDSYKHNEKFIPTGSNGLLEVYVSAIESPERFWLQMLGTCTVDLDRLNDEMTEYYSKKENKKRHKLRRVKCRQIVAAPFTYDNKWYRAEVIDPQIDSEVEEPQVLLYYVDYGDTCKCKKENIYELRTDFLRLRFQAVECILAKVKPKDSAWSEEAIELLGDLTHAGLWKSLIARIHTYKDRPTGVKRETSPIPCVELYDTHGEKTINVAEELVEKGFAVWEEESQSSGLEPPLDRDLTSGDVVAGRSGLPSPPLM